MVKILNNSELISIENINQFEQLIEKEAEFLPFRSIFKKNPGLLGLMYAEKVRYPHCKLEKRIMLMPDGTKIGYVSSLDEKESSFEIDRFHPSQLKPIPLTALWLPIEETTVLSVLDSQDNCKLFRQFNGSTHVLFLIHPHSQDHFRSLLEKHKDKKETVWALSLSSFRTVLVALPNTKGDYDPLMIKLSLAKKLRGVYRLVSQQKCELSVGNTAMLKKRLSLQEEAELALTIFKEPLAIVPKGYHEGMIYREIPDALNPEIHHAEEVSMLPLLSLLGVKNLPFFLQIVEANSDSVSNFLIKYLLSPVARMIVELFYQKGISLEIHPQNLGFVMKKGYQVAGLMYRDMEGVNIDMEKRERETCLPPSLQNEASYYFSSRVKDSADMIEDFFVQSVLGPLTRQLAKCPKFWEKDPQLKEWVEAAAESGYLHNWTLSATNDDYANCLEYKMFFRYGYVEWLFFDCLMAMFKKHRCFDEQTLEKFHEDYTFWIEHKSGDLFPPATFRCFFKTVITMLLERP